MLYFQTAKKDWAFTNFNPARADWILQYEYCAKCHDTFKDLTKYPLFKDENEKANFLQPTLVRFSNRRRSLRPLPLKVRFLSLATSWSSSGGAM